MCRVIYLLTGFVLLLLIACKSQPVDSEAVEPLAPPDNCAVVIGTIRIRIESRGEKAAKYAGFAESAFEKEFADTEVKMIKEGTSDFALSCEISLTQTSHMERYGPDLFTYKVSSLWKLVRVKEKRMLDKQETTAIGEGASPEESSESAVTNMVKDMMPRVVTIIQREMAKTPND
ncbi:MAG: hypothetical protein ABIH42_10445 [Planctomycetota bacterium]